MNYINELLVNLERLESHLDAIEDGSLTARDDLASVLQILVHPGDGYDLIGKALKEIGAPDLPMPAFSKHKISKKYNCNDVHLAIRAVNITSSHTLNLNDMLKQEVIYHDSSVWKTSSSLNWSQIIAKSRNKHGSHVDDKSPAWLKDLRYYPAANADIMTLLLWSFGEALLGSITNHLASNGQGVMPYVTRNSLNGISFQAGMLAAESATKITVAATMMATKEHVGNRTVLGGMYGNQAFILGLDNLRRPTAIIGQPNVPLEDIEHQFITGSDPTGLSRAERRASRKQMGK
jgi:hypothetical protein